MDTSIICNNRNKIICIDIHDVFFIYIFEVTFFQKAAVKKRNNKSNANTRLK